MSSLYHKIVLGSIILLSSQSCNDTSNNPEDIAATINENILDQDNQSADYYVCNEYEESIIAAAETGNFAVVRDYLENGGDPNLCCFHINSIINVREDWLYVDIMTSDSLEFIKYYSNLSLTEHVKNDMLFHFLPDGDNAIIDNLLNGGAKYPTNYICGINVLDSYKVLAEKNYDFNQSYEPDGLTLLMKTAQCPCEIGTAEEIIEVMQFLIDHGARTDLKDNKGRGIMDIAVNEKIIAFLKSLEE